MTDREKAIVMAHTGVCMLTGNKFQKFHKYVEEIMGRPVMTHEIGWLADAIKEKSKADFIALCADEALEQEPCVDAISREDALMALTGEWKESLIEILPKAIKRINELPPVNPAEKVGQWIKCGDIWKCSRCNELSCCKANFCPDCGAKMQEVEE